MGNLNVPKNNLILTLLKMCCCNKSIDNVVAKKKHRNDEEKWNVTLKLFTYLIQTYHKKPYPNVVKNIYFREPEIAQL